MTEELSIRGTDREAHEAATTDELFLMRSMTLRSRTSPRGTNCGWTLPFAVKDARDRAWSRTSLWGSNYGWTLYTVNDLQRQPDRQHEPSTSGQRRTSPRGSNYGLLGRRPHPYEPERQQLREATTTDGRSTYRNTFEQMLRHHYMIGSRIIDARLRWGFGPRNPKSTNVSSMNFAQRAETDHPADQSPTSRFNTNETSLRNSADDWKSRRDPRVVEAWIGFSLFDRIQHWKCVTDLSYLGNQSGYRWNMQTHIHNALLEGAFPTLCSSIGRTMNRTLVGEAAIAWILWILPPSHQRSYRPASRTPKRVRVTLMHAKGRAIHPGLRYILGVMGSAASRALQRESVQRAKCYRKSDTRHSSARNPQSYEAFIVHHQTGELSPGLPCASHTRTHTRDPLFHVSYAKEQR